MTCVALGVLSLKQPNTVLAQRKAECRSDKGRSCRLKLGDDSINIGEEALVNRHLDRFHIATYGELYTL